MFVTASTVSVIFLLPRCPCSAVTVTLKSLLHGQYLLSNNHSYWSGYIVSSCLYECHVTCEINAGVIVPRTNYIHHGQQWKHLPRPLGSSGNSSNMPCHDTSQNRFQLHLKALKRLIFKVRFMGRWCHGGIHAEMKDEISTHTCHISQTGKDVISEHTCYWSGCVHGRPTFYMACPRVDVLLQSPTGMSSALMNFLA